MVGLAAPRDSMLIDALEAVSTAPLKSTVWRVVREGREVTQSSASGGRWDDGTFDVLYTALDRDGAIAEMYFHLLRGQPVFPSKVRYVLYEMTVSLEAVTRLATLPELANLGVDISRFGQLSYVERSQEYPRTQQIGEAVHFLDSDGLLVPNARWTCTNLVVFGDRIAPDAIEVVREHGLIDWNDWQRRNASLMPK